MRTEHDPSDFARNRVATTGGVVEGTREPGSEVRVFRGIPFAEPPVGSLRFAPPRPAPSWPGVRRADRFGPRPMQLPVFGDMSFRSDGMGEDCLRLNVWTPAASADERLPVLVYLYGGGNMAGDGSEPRYDGEALARRGIVVLTVNYRLGVFGFFAHPELSAESPGRGSGNQGYLDQVAALGWVRDNVAAFGGDPGRVTIAGESAGSISVSILMASPRPRGLFAGAIGSSGAAIGGHLAPAPLAEKERAGAELAARVGARSLAALRAMPADALLGATVGMDFPDFRATVDGDLLPTAVEEIFAAGEQARVPLLVGWNSEEASSLGVLGEREPTMAGYEAAVRSLYGEDAAEALRLYPAGADEEVLAAATDLAGDRFIGHGTWRWADLHAATGRSPVYRYRYVHPRPRMVPEMGDAVAGYAGGIVRGSEASAEPAARGAVHSADIEYALGNLATNPVFAWTTEDHALSETMQACYVNFVTTGDPNGEGLPAWPAFASDADGGGAVMRWDVESGAEPERHRERYRFLDRALRTGRGGVDA